MANKQLSTQGGKRIGAGRKKSEIIKSSITLYINVEKINKFNDRKAFITECYKLIENNI